MFSHVAIKFYLAACAVILTHNMIFPVKGQCTIQGCENGETLIKIVAEIQQMFAETIRRQQKEQVQHMHEIFNASFQLIKNQQDTIMTSLQTLDRRSQEQDIHIKQLRSICGFANETLQQMKNQQGTVMTSLQAIDRRSRGQDVYIKQVQSIHELLDASFQQMRTQQYTAIGQLDIVTQLLLYHDISMKNQTQNSTKLTIGVPLRPEVIIDLGEGPVLLPSVNKWIVIMNRFDGSVNFNRGWAEYRNGFGAFERGEFWLGNEIVHRLTNRSELVHTLRIEVNVNGTWFYAEYATFSLDSENDKYVLHLSGYSGNAGDSLIDPSLPRNGFHGGMSFSTNDVDNDICSNVCGLSYRAGWWFSCCDTSCLTGPFGEYHFNWYPLRHLSSNGRLRAARMMIRSSN